MTKLTPQQLETIAKYELGKTRNIQLGLDLHAELFIFMYRHRPELNGNVSALIREACWQYINKGDSDIAQVIRETLRQELGRIKVVTQEVTEESNNGKVDDSEGFFSWWKLE